MTPDSTDEHRQARLAPRPALAKAPDGSVHPASPHLSSLAVSLPPPEALASGLAELPGVVAPKTSSTETPQPGRAATSKKSRKREKTGKGKPRGKGDAKVAGRAAPTGDLVQLVVALPKPVRKALRRRSAEYGWSAEEAAAHVLRVWAES